MILWWQKKFTGIQFHDFSKDDKIESHWIALFLLLINVIIIKHAAETKISLLK